MQWSSDVLMLLAKHFKGISPSVIKVDRYILEDKQIKIVCRVGVGIKEHYIMLPDSFFINLSSARSLH